ncbi:MAG: transcription termination factor Rho [Candidatus Tectomicrobia bacterium]|nr:transcription termination factor Rho [Candidatus Tectomicrobia bacterium]
MEKKDLEKLTVPKLREEALEHPDQIKGVHGMTKEQLVSALMEVLGIPEPKEEGERPARTGRVRKVARSRAELKKKIRVLKEERQKAHEAGEHKIAALLRRRIHVLKRLTRRAVVAK